MITPTPIDFEERKNTNLNPLSEEWGNQNLSYALMITHNMIKSLRTRLFEETWGKFFN